LNKGLLESAARRMGEEPGGILAADESIGTMGSRLNDIGITDNPEDPTYRNAWRAVMFGASLRPAVNGVILFEEQLANPKLVNMLTVQGVLPGIKIDQGLAFFAGSDVEQVTLGLDGVEKRLKLYSEQGAAFTKFRSFIHIREGQGMPSDACILANAKAQAGFARASQDSGRVPMVEPEVNMVGEHPIEYCAEVTEQVLRIVFEELDAAGVHLPGMVLKPNMILSGSKAKNRAAPEAVARATVDVLSRVVPDAVPVIAFLSGGQTDEEAYANLSAINLTARAEGHPWRLTYSFGRAAQKGALNVWRGSPYSVQAARARFVELLAEMSAASMGAYPTVAV